MTHGCKKPCLLFQKQKKVLQPCEKGYVVLTLIPKNIIWIGYAVLAINEKKLLE